MSIQVLPDHVVNKISAGEVVERPSSVVRELVDNSLDAGADEISVYLENGGHSLIRVVDNGSGMDRNDALLAFERHATSKIHNENDLNEINTLGFRGEALPSIAAVAQLRLKTRCRESEMATELVIDGGKLKGATSTSGNLGTDISVQHLFFNTPARRKFLKAERTEELRVKSWIQQSSIAHSNVHYKLYLNGKEVLNLPKRKSSHDRALTLFKGATLSFQESFEAAGGPGQGGMHIEVEGLIGHPSLALADSSAFVVLVNGRLISDRMLVRAVKDGFDSTLKEREYPVGFLSIKIPPSLVDVNVHPQKSEVRFSDSRTLFSLVQRTVKKTVQSFKAPVVGFSDFGKGPSSYTKAGTGQIPQNQLTPQALFGVMPAGGSVRDVGVDYSSNACISDVEQSTREAFAFSNLRYIGQLFSCYLLCESNGQFVIVDMHAAHERYNFNLIRNSVSGGDLPSQLLLLPITLELTEEQAQRLSDQGDTLKSFGFKIEMRDLSSINIFAIPSLLDSGSAESALKELASVDIESETDGSMKKRIDAISARIACHASVRSGANLEREEVYALFSSLDSSEFSTACPHGRPVVVSFSETAVERWFGRDR